MVTIRAACPDEAEWVNARYAAVRFMPSDLSREVVLIAESGGQPAGLGRLVPVVDAFELGGMFVFDGFRGKGVARALIDALIERAGEKTIYCIPFASLESLYAAAGFERCHDAPRPVREKFAWCQTEYDQPVLLMRRLTTGSTPDVPPSPPRTSPGRSR
jgi:GNAT superfamily N-acetyltransferase